MSGGPHAQSRPLAAAFYFALFFRDGTGHSFAASATTSSGAE